MNKGRIAFPACAVLALALASMSCASQMALDRAKELQASGDWAGAALQTIESLKHDNKNADAARYAVFVIPQAIKAELERIAAAKSSSSETSWEEIVKGYENIHAINDAWLALPTITHPDTKQPIVFTLTYYREELAAAKQNAAWDNYQRGVEFMSRGGQANCREAYRYFMKAISYVPDYKDARSLAEETRIKGSDSLVIVPFAELPGALGGLQPGDTLTAWTNAGIAAVAKTRTFLRVIDQAVFMAALGGATGTAAWVDAGNRVGATHMITGQVRVSDWIAPDTTTWTERAVGTVDVPIWVSTVPPAPGLGAGAPIVVYQPSNVAVTLYPIYGSPIGSGTSYSYTWDFRAADGSPVRFYGVTGDAAQAQALGTAAFALTGYVNVKQQVEAFLTWRKKSVAVELGASFSVFDLRTNVSLFSGNYVEKARDECVWLTFTGDERALTAAQRDASKARERPLESERSLADKALKAIADKIAKEIAKLFP